MSSPLKSNHAKSSSFVWNANRTRLINKSAITLPYYASLGASQLTPSELSCDLPIVNGSIHNERGCSTTHNSLSHLTMVDSGLVHTQEAVYAVNMGTCVQLELGLATGTNQTHSKLKPGLTTCSSQPVPLMTHNKHSFKTSNRFHGSSDLFGASV
jgi:hypothetical protein